MDDELTEVPENLEVPDQATAEYAQKVGAINEFLETMRQERDEMRKEVKRLGQIRANFPIHNGPGGVILLD